MLLLCDVSVSYKVGHKLFNSGLNDEKFGGFWGVLDDFLQINSEI